MADEVHEGDAVRPVSSGADPVVEDNGPWFAVFLVVLVFLFAAAFAALVHSLGATFG